MNFHVRLYMPIFHLVEISLWLTTYISHADYKTLMKNQY